MEYNIGVAIYQNKVGLGKAETRVLAGVEGIKGILEDMLVGTEGNFMDITSALTVPLLCESYLNEWQSRRVKEGINGRFLVHPSEEGIPRGRQLANLERTEVRTVLGDYELPNQVYIRGNKVGLAFPQAGTPVGIIIANQEIANMYIRFFDNLWKISKPV